MKEKIIKMIEELEDQKILALIYEILIRLK